jgi:maleylpyruvate isomerase
MYIDRDLARSITAAHRRLEASLTGLSDASVREPSLLPDWSVGHVLTHIARNADSFTHLLNAAARGEIGTQYPGGMAERNHGIEQGADRRAADIVSDVRRANAEFEEAMAATTEELWASGQANTALGLSPLASLPFRRLRETEVHHHDAGLPSFSWRDWSDSYVQREFPLMLGRLPQRLGAVGVHLNTPSGSFTVPEGAADAPSVTADLRSLVAWMADRHPVPDWPSLTSWF